MAAGFVRAGPYVIIRKYDRNGIIKMTFVISATYKFSLNFYYKLLRKNG